MFLIGIINFTHRAMASTITILLADGIHIDSNLDAKIATAFTYSISQIAEFELGVGISIARHDVSTLATHQLVDSQVFEMPTIGKVDVFAAIVCGGKQL